MEATAHELLESLPVPTAGWRANSGGRAWLLLMTADEWLLAFGEMESGEDPGIAEVVVE